MEVGLRVVRGPDWDWGNQDDGEGHVGTVVEIVKPGSTTLPDKTVVVQWDSGSQYDYRVGYQGAYDLRIFDNAVIGVNHQHIVCDACYAQNIQGMRWKCTECFDYELCSLCYMADEHDLGHLFQRFDTPSSKGVKVLNRCDSSKTQCWGIFAGALVIRGPDRDWENQDDDELGEVTDLETGNSAATVVWSSGSTNGYRVGHKGKVDLKYEHAASGGYYYMDHLPLVGDSYSEDESAIPVVKHTTPKVTYLEPTNDKAKESTQKQNCSSEDGWARAQKVNHHELKKDKAKESTQTQHSKSLSSSDVFESSIDGSVSKKEDVSSEEYNRPHRTLRREYVAPLHILRPLHAKDERCMPKYEGAAKLLHRNGHGRKEDSYSEDESAIPVVKHRTPKVTHHEPTNDKAKESTQKQNCSSEDGSAIPVVKSRAPKVNHHELKTYKAKESTQTQHLQNYDQEPGCGQTNRGQQGGRGGQPNSDRMYLSDNGALRKPIQTIPIQKIPRSPRVEESTNIGALQKPIQITPSRQEVVETTNNEYLKLVAESASKTFICEQQFLIGRCSNRGCRLLHSNGLHLPYIWQVKLFGAWTSVGDPCIVESSFGDPRNRSSKATLVDGLGTSHTVEIHFDDGGSSFAQCALGELPARRLSTKSYGAINVQPSSFLTRWVWYWLDHSGWQRFKSDELQYTLESKYQFGQKTFLYSRDNYRFNYSIDFTTMEQTNIKTRKVRTVTRRPTYVHKGTLQFISIPRAPAPLPARWAPWDFSQPFELVELNTDDADYITVEKSFYTTLRRGAEVIDHIYRMQCVSLWIKRCSHRKSMVAAAERAGRGFAIDERKLFHGTDSLDVVRGICINNFDPRMSGKNATRYGEGAYFHKNAKYSHAYTGNNSAERFMFQAIVLVGDFVLGDPSYRRPPARPGTTHELYDSCVDRVSDPMLFVVFDRDQQYPEYLIQYHDKQQPEGPVVEERPAPPRPTTNPSTGALGAMSYPSEGAMSYPSEGAMSYPTEGAMAYPTEGAMAYPASQVSYPTTSRRQRASRSVKEEKNCSIQ